MDLPPDPECTGIHMYLHYNNLLLLLELLL